MLSWPFLMRRLSPVSGFAGASEPELKTPLFDQPLSIICGEDDTLPRPIQVGVHSLVNLLQVFVRCERALGALNIILLLHLMRPVFGFFLRVWKRCFHMWVQSGEYLAVYIPEISSACPPSFHPQDLMELRMLKMCSFWKVNRRRWGLKCMIRNPAFIWNNLKGGRPEIILECKRLELSPLTSS